MRTTETTMRTTETTAEIRSLTDVELDEVTGGLIIGVAIVAGFLCGGALAAYWDLPKGAPKNLDQLYASW
jgi:hypothetical protein